MKRWRIVFVVALAMIILLTPCAPQAASMDAQPQPGGILKLILKTIDNNFGYPPKIGGTARDSAPPFFDRLLSVGEDGKYKPGLALSWDTSADGKTMTFKLKQGVTFHDGTPFNAQAVKANLDNIIPPKATILPGISSVDVIDDYTFRLNLASYNNLILFHFATNTATYMYSPEALKKNSADWAMTHPIGTGPFMLKNYQPKNSLTLVKNPNYWQKGLPYLDGIVMTEIPNPMTQTITLKAGQANAIYDATSDGAVQLRDDGYPVVVGPGTFIVLNFDTKNSEIFSKRQVREAIEYAIDKEAICDGPGHGLYKPGYQLVPSTSPDYNKACPPRKYDPAKAKQLLAEAGYPNGFSFKNFVQSSTWKDGWVAVQSYLDKVGIKMEINYIDTASYNLIRQGGKIERGASAYGAYPSSSNSLYTLDSFWRSNSPLFRYVVTPPGVDQLIDQAKLTRDAAAVTRINQQVLKIYYDDETVVPLWQNPRIYVTDKAVQNTGWFIYDDPQNNDFGTRTWLKK